MVTDADEVRHRAKGRNLARDEVPPLHRAVVVERQRRYDVLWLMLDIRVRSVRVAKVTQVPIERRATPARGFGNGGHHDVAAITRVAGHDKPPRPSHWCAVRPGAARPNLSPSPRGSTCATDDAATRFSCVLIPDARLMSSTGVILSERVPHHHRQSQFVVQNLKHAIDALLTKSRQTPDTDGPRRPHSRREQEP